MSTRGTSQPLTVIDGHISHRLAKPIIKVVEIDLQFSRGFCGVISFCRNLFAASNAVPSAKLAIVPSTLIGRSSAHNTNDDVSSDISL